MVKADPFSLQDKYLRVTNYLILKDMPLTSFLLILIAEARRPPGIPIVTGILQAHVFCVQGCSQ